MDPDRNQFLTLGCSESSLSGLYILGLAAIRKNIQNHAIADKPTDADSLYGRGLAERGRGNASAAAADMAVAIAMKPNIVDIYALYFRNHKNRGHRLRAAVKRFNRRDAAPNR